MHQPLARFQQWSVRANENNPQKQKNAICISSIDKDGFPASRFVDLKEIDDTGVIFCSATDSTKGFEIQRNPRVSLCIWWDHVGYQVRMKGLASVISEKQADGYWHYRNREAKIVSSTFKQSAELTENTSVESMYTDSKNRLGEGEISRPANWSGYHVALISIEFLTFRENRLHLRELFSKDSNEWQRKLLQP